MDHVVYVDARANEMERLLNGSKSMLIRGAAGRKMPHGRVQQGDTLYFINNNAEGLVKAKAVVRSAFSSEKLSEEESFKLIESRQDKLQLNEAQIKHWAGKRYLVLLEVEQVTPLEPFAIDKSGYSNMDDWLPVEDIQKVKL